MLLPAFLLGFTALVFTIDVGSDSETRSRPVVASPLPSPAAPVVATAAAPAPSR